MSGENADWKDRLVHGNCLEVLRTVPDSVVDLIATDPPYALTSILKRFGKKGSAAAQEGDDGSFRRLSAGFMGKQWDSETPSVDIWRECLRVLKPGGFAFVLMTARQDSLAETIYRMKEAGFYMGFTSLYWTYLTGFPKCANMAKLIDRKLGCKGKVVGRSKNKIHMENLGDAGYKEEWDVVEPESDEAKQMAGSYTGFSPKPAVEVIVVAMKPLSEKTYVEQAMKDGKGVTWLDDCRIPYANDDDKDDVQRIYGGGKGIPPVTRSGSPKGRFPANLLVSDDALNDGNERKSGKMVIDSSLSAPEWSGKYSGERSPGETIGDSGSFSRSFDLDRWFEGLVGGLPPEVRKILPFLAVAKPSKSEKNRGIDMGIDNSDKWDGKFPGTKADRGVATKHPTVKPIALMSYLVTMGSRERDLVLDPFVGTGTTAIAARMLNRHYLGIELSEEYYDVACERLKPFMNKRLWEF